MGAQGHTEEPAEDAGETTAEALLRILEEVTRDVPAEAWGGLPNDGAVNHDHYLYGAPKRGAPE